MAKLEVLDALDPNKIVQEAARLLVDIRTTGKQSAMMPFLQHFAFIVNEVDKDMADAVAYLNDNETLNDELFAKVFGSGSSHGILLNFCRLHEKDPNDAVRLACSSGEALLAKIVCLPEHAKVIEAVRNRLKGLI